MCEKVSDRFKGVKLDIEAVMMNVSVVMPYKLTRDGRER